MNTEILGVVAQIVILLLLSYPLGKLLRYIKERKPFSTL